MSSVAFAPQRLQAAPEPLPRDLVDRPRLVQALAATDVRMAVIAAAAGYGKTTLLGQWEHSDPRRFIRPGSGATRVHRALRTAASDTVVVLDDDDALRDPAVLDAIACGRPHSLVAIASRTEPELPLGRLRAERGLLELGERELAMTPDEAVQLLDHAGVRLSAAPLAALLRKTEGWPAGLILAALSLRGDDDPDAAALQFGGDNRLIADYLRDEMVSELAPEIALFVARTSVLDDLSGPLCDAALERRGSGRILRDLARSNVLVTRLDSADRQYRYHPLLAEMMGAELARDDVELGSEVHRRASRWHADRDEFEPAAVHAIAAGERDRAVELIWDLVPKHLGRGDHASLDAWVARFRPTEIRSRPPLALTAAAAALLRGDPDAAERSVDAAETGLRRLQPDGRRALEGCIATIHAGIGRGGLAAIREAAQRARRMVAPDSAWRTLAQFLTGITLHLSGDRAAAATELGDAVRHGSQTAPFLEALCLGQLALIAIDDEDWDEALALTGRALESFTDLDAAPTLVLAPSALARAQIGDAATAQDHAACARRRLARRGQGPSWYEAETRIFLARAELRLTDAEAARRLLAGASRALRGTPDAPVAHDWIDAAWEQSDAFAAGGIGTATLTTAELRVLRFLPSHMAFREIATVLHVSTNTVKTQAHAVYRKLGAGSRSEAVARARSIGLVDA